MDDAETAAVPDGATDPAPVPAGVRAALIALAAQVLGAMDKADVPAPLRHVHRFAPRRRVSAGAVPLWAMLDQDDAFRHQVATVWSSAWPDLAVAVLAADPDAGAPTDAAVGAWLLRPSGWGELVERAAGAEEAALAAEADDADLARLRDRAARAEADVARLSTELALARVAVAAAIDEASELRRDARKLRSDADRARSQARAALEEAAAERAAAEHALEQAGAESARAADLERRVGEQQRATKATRAADRDLEAVRIKLLLDTVVDSAVALRDELALPPAGAHPADLVAPAAGREPEQQRRGSRGRSTDDPAFVDELITLPHAHLVVDGYNVTKTGYPEMPLEAQRRRLVEALAHLAGRSGAEVTCCFDGQDVGHVPASSTRSVRVLFSSGEIADDLIRRIVRAEPTGRVVVVASSDQEVARDVQLMGASSVSARGLLDRLAWL